MTTSASRSPRSWSHRNRELRFNDLFVPAHVYVHWQGIVLSRGFAVGTRPIGFHLGRPGAMKADSVFFQHRLGGTRYGQATILGVGGHASTEGRAPEAVAWERATCINAPEVLRGAVI